MRLSKKISERLLDLIFPLHKKCIFCDGELNELSYNDTCETCLKTLPFIKKGCVRCGSPLAENNEILCFNCKANEFDFVQAKSVFAYVDDVVKAVHNYKYNSMRFLSEPFAEYLCSVLSTWSIYPDIITSVPLHPNREKTRGYNQSKLMAQIVAEKFKIRYEDLCDKVIDNPSQTALTSADRRANVKDAYKLKPEFRRKLKGETILIIDDIYTTGATTNELSKILKSVRAGDVYVLTFAHGLGDLKR